MISHKNEMLSKTSSLIGVTSTVFDLKKVDDKTAVISDDQRDLADKDQNQEQIVKMLSAITFSLDLEKYRPANEVAE